jgi:hypothetical protein
MSSRRNPIRRMLLATQPSVVTRPVGPMLFAVWSVLYALVRKSEVVNAVSILETPSMVAISVVRYVETPLGLRTLTSVFADYLNEEFKRRLYKNWYRSKQEEGLHQVCQEVHGVCW